VRVSRVKVAVDEHGATQRELVASALERRPECLLDGTLRRRAFVDPRAGRTRVEREPATVARHRVDRGQRGGETIDPARIVRPCNRAARQPGRDDEPSRPTDATVTEKLRRRHVRAVQYPQGRCLSTRAVAIGEYAHDDCVRVGWRRQTH
jgi:hypothetical protein